MSDPNEEPADDILQDSENGDGGEAAEIVGDDQQDSLIQDESGVLNETTDNDLDETAVDDPVGLPVFTTCH